MANARQRRNLELYAKAYLARVAEETIRRHYPGDEMKTPVHLSLGEEAIVAGVCQALMPTDQVFGTYRNHALFLCRGGSLDAFFGELLGRATGVAQGKAGSMHLSDPARGFLASSAIVSSVIPLALGAAFAAKSRGNTRVAAVFFGDGATEEGVFWESVNAASVMGLPVLFVCEDNGLAIHSHKHTRQSYSIPAAAKTFGIQTASSDTTDAQDVHRLAAKAVRRLRNGLGPQFLHLKYHRYLEHVGICEDYACGYRQADPDFLSRDPVAVARAGLIGAGVAESAVAALEEGITLQVDRAYQAARLAPAAPDTCLIKDVYA